MEEFGRFWKQMGTNLIIGLVITLVLCVLMGLQELWFSLPVWILIAVGFWAIRVVLLFINWKRSNKD